MPFMKHIIHKLELSLLEPSVRKSIAKLNQLIADDFIEFGSLGKIYSKKDVLEFLSLEQLRKFVVEDFTVTELSPEIMLVTYKAKIDSVTSLRSSIWKINNGNWQMVFHQGTRV
jgi:hypothetical protein